MEIFVANIVLYGLWLFWSFRNRDECSAFYIFSVAMYFVVACIGVFVFEIGLYQDEISDHRSMEYLSFIPYALMFVMMAVALYPLKAIPKFELGWEKRRISRCSVVFLFLILAHLLFYLYGFQFGLVTDAGDAYYMSASGDLGLRYGSDVEVIISKILRRLSICVMPVFFYLQFYRISKNQQAMMALLFLVLGFCAYVIPPILNGSRGGMFFDFFIMIYIYLNFSSEIPVKMKKLLYAFVILVLLGLVFYALVVSVARAKGDSDVAVFRIFRYFGEPFLNLGLVYWNSTDVHTYGVRFFPKVLEWVGGLELPDSKYGAEGLREFWTHIYGVNMYYFKTLFGDLYMEFGVIGSYVVVIVLALVARFVKKLKNSFLCHFIMFYYARNVVIYGIFGFGMDQKIVVDLAYAIVFWVIFSRFWNPVKKQDESLEKLG